MNSKAGFLVAAANTPWVYTLAETLARCGNPVAAVTLYDWLTHRRIRPQWPNAECPDLLLRMNWVFPTGYMGALEPVFRPVLRARWRRLLHRLGQANAPKPWIVCPYPWLVGSLSNLDDGRLIYFNLDDYALYRPERADRILEQESELVRRARFVFCLAQSQVSALRWRFPDRADMVRHLPLAVPDALVNPAPGLGFRANTVGYVGNLIDRVDWRLVGAVARLLPDVEFVFVGYANVSSGGGRRPDWRRERDEALRLPNVRRVKTVPQSEVTKHYWSFAVTWIPYATDHAFNYASCPTKIMDGLASGRPVLSTDIPECRLYPEWICLMQTPEQAAAVIHETLSGLQSPNATERSQRQVEFVTCHHRWDERAAAVEEWISSAETMLPNSA